MRRTGDIYFFSATSLATAPDSVGSLLASTVSPDEEPVQALGLLKQITVLRDLDRFLSENSEDFDKSIENSRMFLSNAGYDTTSYEEWARNVATFAARAGILPSWRLAVIAYLQSANDGSRGTPPMK